MINPEYDVVGHRKEIILPHIPEGDSEPPRWIPVEAEKNCAYGDCKINMYNKHSAIK